MSPTLLVQDGFKFFFYANEHPHGHIHVVKGDDYATNDLSRWRAQNFLRPTDVKKVLTMRRNTGEFERKWEPSFRVIVHFDDKYLHVELEDADHIHTDDMVSELRKVSLNSTQFTLSAEGPPRKAQLDTISHRSDAADGSSESG